MKTSRGWFGAKQQADDEALDFEIVGVNEAREALDQGHDITTVAGALAPEPQQSLPARRPAVRQDAPKEQLPPETVRWIVSLPAAARPLHLFLHYPKLGNRLALLWENTGDAQQFFNDLLMDMRGGRQGFPKEVFDDLMRLQHLLNERSAQPSTW